MINRIARFFHFAEHGTNLRREIIGGVTTFMTMSYIVVVNPAILKAAGIPAEASMVATIVTAILGTVVMGLYANRPFAIAPYMGENAFLAYGGSVRSGSQVGEHCLRPACEPLGTHGPGHPSTQAADDDVPRKSRAARVH
jgi:xanthine/uracil/vitamin C permease (AzgA family)